MKIDLCSCKVALGGSRDQIVVRNEFNPVTWPEVLLLEFAHGENSVTDLQVVGQRETTMAAEVERLKLRYKANDFAECFPGAKPKLDMEAPKDIPRAKKKAAPKAKAPAKSAEDPFKGEGGDAGDQKAAE